MVDCRPAAGAAPHELAHSAPNGGAPPDAHHNQAGGGGDMGGHNISSPSSARASTPSTTNTLATYTGGMNPPNVGTAPMVGPGAPPGAGAGAGSGVYNQGAGCAPYVCGVKSVVWCAPHSPPPPPHGVNPHGPHVPHAPPPPPPPPPHGVNPHVYKSVQANGSDLPMNDIPTLRYYFNLGVECMWAAYGAPPLHPPPRHYSPRDLTQDMQQIAIHDRPVMNHNSGGEQNHKQKPPPPNDKPPLNQGKGNGQRPLLGPRFKRGGNNQDGNQNSNNHNQNKGHNNNMGNKGPNNRRNSHTDIRNNQQPPHMYASPEGGECVMEQPLLTLPYIHYPPPMYPIQYYPLESDPAMMSMMGGIGYLGYEEGVDFGGVPGFYPHPHAHPHAHFPPPHPHPHQPHPHHAQHQPHQHQQHQQQHHVEHK